MLTIRRLGLRILPEVMELSKSKSEGIGPQVSHSGQL
jgi:hypothetical protein